LQQVSDNAEGFGSIPLAQPSYGITPSSVVLDDQIMRLVNDPQSVSDYVKDIENVMKAPDHLKMSTLQRLSSLRFNPSLSRLEESLKSATAAYQDAINKNRRQLEDVANIESQILPTRTSTVESAQGAIDKDLSVVDAESKRRIEEFMRDEEARVQREKESVRAKYIPLFESVDTMGNSAHNKCTSRKNQLESTIREQEGALEKIHLEEGLQQKTAKAAIRALTKLLRADGEGDTKAAEESVDAVFAMQRAIASGNNDLKKAAFEAFDEK
jgi:hypothetical protein